MIPRDSKYLAFVRTLPCVICKCPSEAHHEITGGTGIKGSDLSTIPLCREHHMQRHNLGVKSFWSRHGLNRFEVIANCEHLFLTGEKLTMVLN